MDDHLAQVDALGALCLSMGRLKVLRDSGIRDERSRAAISAVVRDYLAALDAGVPKEHALRVVRDVSECATTTRPQSNDAHMGRR